MLLSDLQLGFPVTIGDVTFDAPAMLEMVLPMALSIISWRSSFDLSSVSPLNIFARSCPTLFCCDLGAGDCVFTGAGTIFGAGTIVGLGISPVAIFLAICTVILPLGRGSFARSFDSDRLSSLVDGAAVDDTDGVNAGGVVGVVGIGVPVLRRCVLELSTRDVFFGVCRGFALMLSRSPLRFATTSSPGSP